MKKIFAFLTFLLLCSSSYAQDIAGTWYGSLKLPGTNLNLVFHITKNNEGYNSTMDSPMQGANGIPMGKTTYVDKTLTVDASNLGIRYTGTFSVDSNKITGTFQQNGHNIPLILGTKPDQSAFKMGPRPQDPKDFPYKQEEVAFVNPKGGNTLAGTLTLPADGKATKIVILITGSGPQNRNEEIKQFNHRPFLVLSDNLCRNGIAVLRYDDRGIGKSTGDFQASTTADFADDAEAAVNYIQSRPDLKRLSIGLVGHSEGGMIAPMVANRSKNVKFIVLMAGPGIEISQLYTQQLADQIKLSGAPEETISRVKASYNKIFSTLKTYKDLPADQAKVKTDSLLYSEFRKLPATDLAGNIDEIVKNSSEVYKNPWFRYFIAFNPADYLTRVKCPVLALNGTLDSQVESTTNLFGIKTALEKAKNPKFEIVPMDSLNHLFQKAKTGAVSEYAQIDETINPAALQIISSWIKSQ